MKWTPYLAGILPFGELFKGGKLFWWLLCTAGVIFCIYRTVGCFLEIRRRLPARILLMAGCMVTGMMIIYLADMDNLPPAMAVFLAAVWLGCGGSPMKRITIGLIISCTVFTYNALIDNYLLYGLRHDTGTAAEILSGFLRLAFSGVLYICARYFSPKHKDFELSRALWRILLLLTAAPVGIVLCIVLLSRYGEIRNDLQDMALLGLSLFSFAGLLGTTAVLARQKELEEEQNFFRLNEKYYKTLKEQNFEVRRIKHDLANHLQTILSLPEKEREDYIKSLLDNPAAYRTMRYCGDDTVNIILSAKEALMEQKGIEFRLTLDIPGPLPIEKTDICAILGNALDNAIEGVSALPEKKDPAGAARYISLEGRYAKGIFALKIENPGKEPALPDRHGLFRTTKKYGELHGYGLLSIKEAVKRYEGNLDARWEEGKFILFLYLHL